MNGIAAGLVPCTAPATLVQKRNLVSLMIAKYCLRYSYNLCPKQIKDIRLDFSVT